VSLRRPRALLWGIFGYLCAVRSLVYLVFFLEGAWVRRTVDSGPAATAATAAAVDAGLFALFAAVHSVMARRPVKAALARVQPAELERSTYAVVSGLLLALLFWQWRPLLAAVWEVEAPAARAAVHSLGVGGWLLALVAIRTLGHGRLFGIAQAWRYARGEPPPEARLVRGGVYGRLRHPLNLAFLLGVWGTPAMSQGRLLFAGLATLYVVAGIRWEERDLLRRHGEAYARYRAEVPALLPFVRRRPTAAAASR
jgi:protein-S-isoprenylcysteine O-methyltransferase Ste14